MATFLKDNVSYTSFCIQGTMPTINYNFIILAVTYFTYLLEIKEVMKKKDFKGDLDCSFLSINPLEGLLKKYCMYPSSL